MKKASLVFGVAAALCLVTLLALSFNASRSDADTSGSSASSYFVSTDLKATDFFIDTDLESNNVIVDTPVVAPSAADTQARLCYKNYCENVSASCPVSLLFTREAAIGNSGIDIVALQTYLASRKYLVMPANTAKGYFGGVTAAALARYQNANGLAPSGKLDTATLTYLNDNMLTGPACYAFVRYDAITLKFAPNIDISRMVPQFNNLGFTGSAGQPFCKTNTSASSCINVFGGNAFTAYIPSKYGVTKVAAAFLKSGAFSQVAYVTATQRMISGMPLLQPPQQ